MGGSHVCSGPAEVPLRAILSCLGDFVGAGLRPRTPLAKAIVLVLAIKLIGIAAVRIYLVADSTGPVDAGAMARVIGAASQR